MITELLLLIIIITNSLNINPFLSKLKEETEVRKENCEK